jgi:para-aminobenzoate synthetase/4-amino-4-deoxychorismate lyase
VTGPVPDGAVGGGWVGALGFGLGALVERVPPSPPPAVVRAAGADAPLAFYDHLLRQDPEGRWWFEALWTDDRAGALRARLAALRARAPVPARPFGTGPWRSEPGPAGHGRAVAAAVERIARGDLFQANLTLRLTATLRGDAVDLFAAASRALDAAHAAFVTTPDGAIASLSPELFLRRRGRSVLSAPIKGTRPDAGDPAELAGAEKDRAEHVMIVDLVRNDLGRVCVPGSIGVRALAEPRRAPGVWHLVSDVAGELRDEGHRRRAAPRDVPARRGHGAPKVAALGVIAELESTGREAYTGAIGLACPRRGASSSASPSAPSRPTATASGSASGGGVVADSDPPPRRRGGDEGRPAPRRDRRHRTRCANNEGSDPSLRGQRPGAGAARAAARAAAGPRRRVFTTLRADGGVPVDLDAHLARLAASVRALYGGRCPGAARGGRRGGRAGRARAGDGPAGRVARRDRGRARAAATRPAAARAGHGPGRARGAQVGDRRLLEALEAHVAPALPLLVDLDGRVLEASRASVVATLPGGRRVTPPADGRILPGTTVAALLAAGAVAEHPLTLAELHGAVAVELAWATRGLTPAAVTG